MAGRVFVRVAAVLGLVLFGFIVGLVALNVVGVAPSGTEGSVNDPPASPAALVGAASPGESVHAVGAIGLFVVGVVSIARLILQPQDAAAARQVLAVSTAWVITVPIVGDPNNVGGQAGPVDPIFLAFIVPSLIAGLSARPWRRPSGTRDRGLLVLAAVGVGPAAWYAVDQALMQRNTFPPTADPHHNAHWWVMAIVTLAVVLVIASAGLSTGGRVWTVPAPLIGLAIGLASIVTASSASAVRWPWAVSAMAWCTTALMFLFRRGDIRAGSSSV